MIPITHTVAQVLHLEHVFLSIRICGIFVSFKFYEKYTFTSFVFNEHIYYALSKYSTIGS